MKGIHIMTDIETLGIDSDTTIFQIAAAAFTFDNDEIIDRIDLKLDISTVDKMIVNGSTLKWWMETDAELLKQLFEEGNLTEIEMLQSFVDWVNKFDKPRLWGNGIIFDNRFIMDKLQQNGIKYPIYYKHDRDVRTILAIAADVSGLSESEISKQIEDENERAHNAIDDVTKQIRLVKHCYNIIKSC